MASVKDLTQQSGFVFEARLEQLGASNATGYPSAAETAIVHISRIIKSTSTLSGYNDQRITVHLQSPVTLKVGDQAVFFTHGVHYGEGLVVGEVGHSPGAAATNQAELSSAAQASDDFEFQQRLAQAELVITGRAGDPKPHPNSQMAPVDPIPGKRPVSEHDPDWWTTTVTLESVEKGTHSGPTHEVAFSNSMDIAWYCAPKIKAGDHGVFLLHNRSVHGKAVPSLAVSHQLDFHPIGELNRVRALLKPAAE